MKIFLSTGSTVGTCALLLMLQAGMPATGHAADAAAAAGTATSSGSQDVLQEVVVTGLRANLEKSLDTKKNAAVVLDSIDSTELGRFPDADVADSLEHLPGITIKRTTGGEGASISVRGLGKSYNIVTLSNRILASDDDSRDLAFDVLPAELITGAEVLKSPQASAVEGSIGGTVNLRTASAFDKPGLHIGAHAEGDWNQMSRLHGSKFAAFMTDTNDTGTLGLVLGAVHSSQNVRTDSLNAYNQNIYGPVYYNPNGPVFYPQPDPTTGAVPPGSIPLTATPCCITFGSIFDDKKRDALMGKLEWRPNDAFRVAADVLYTHLNDPQQGYNESYYFAANPDGTPWENNAVVHNGVITAVSVDQFQPEMVNNTVNRKVDTWMYGLNGQWQPNDRLTLAIDLYRSTASRPEGGQDSFVTAGLVDSSPVARDILNLTDLPHSLPGLNVAVPPAQLGLAACPPGTVSATNAGYCSYTALMNSGFLNDNKYWSTHYDGFNGYSVHDRITGFSLDGSWRAQLGAFDKLLFGVGGTRREKDRQDISNDWTNGSSQYGTLYLTAGCPLQCAPYSFGSQGFNVVSMTSPPNFMHGAGGSYPTTLPVLNVAQLINFMRSLDGKPNPLACTSLPCPTVFDYALTQPQVNPYNSYAVTEKSISGYLEGLFSGERWSGNLGLRLLHTTTTAQTAAAVPVDLWTLNPNSTTVSYTVDYGTSQPIGANGSYTMALPSLNFAYWVVPDSLQAHFSAAQTMARPDLSYLAPTSSNNALNGDPQLYYGGTAGLKPVRANQADLSLEWYYAPHSAFTAAVFAKKILNDIYSGTQTSVDLGTIKYDGGKPGTVPGVPFLWTVYAPANGARSTYSGVELTWQHIMDNGFGTRMQFTATRTRSYDQNGAFVGAINQAPPTTFTIGLLYDKGPIAADVNWDHQSGYTASCSQCTEVPGWPAISDPFDWVTASLHYRFGGGFEVYLEGQNLTDSIARTYLNGDPLLPWAPGQSVGQSSSGVGYGYSAYGRSYILGISWHR
ncbi:MAG: TonB-dependent receptor [Proteobacteria bacterium]|nr:TonB-dependent receptor [Pseudomonadota bacterium]